MRALQRLRNLVAYLPQDSAIARALNTKQDSLTQSTREFTLDEIKKLHPHMFTSN
jgi:hypothetical protein